MFIGAPFGLKPLASVLQRFMSNILSPIHDAYAFQDDITIATASADPREHLRVVIRVINVRISANLRSGSPSPISLNLL